MTKLTAKTIDAQKLASGKKELIVYDEDIPGFGLRIREGGSRTLVLSYKIGRRSRRLNLGPAVREAFPDVRKRALDPLARVRLGQDPAAVKDAGRQQAVETFEKLVERFLVEHEKEVKPKTHRDMQRYLTVAAKPLADRPLATITKRDIAEILSAAVAERGAVSANRLRSALSSMFVWSMKEGLCEHNPTIETHRRTETPRKRVLVDPETGNIEELVAVWKALDGSTFGDVARLLILTGQRRNEIAGLRWSELDEEVTRIKLPDERTKNGLPHLIPLSAPAREILTRRYRIVGRPCVFSRGGGYASWGRFKGALDGRLQEARKAASREPMLPWVIHDLRRSVATGMAKIGILPHVVEAVLNHQSGSKAGVAGVYNLNTYLPEKTAALTLWAEHLMAAISGNSAKVVPLRNIR
jgi:integrase